MQYDSSMMGHDYDCYYARQLDIVELKKPLVRGRVTRLVEMPISWSLDDFPALRIHAQSQRQPCSPGLMNAAACSRTSSTTLPTMTQVQPDFGILTYTFHPHVIGRGHRMMMLEKLIKRLAEGGAVFMSMEEAMKECSPASRLPRRRNNAPTAATSANFESFHLYPNRTGEEPCRPKKRPPTPSPC